MAAFPGANGRIGYAVESYYHSPSEVHTIRPNGTGDRLLALPSYPSEPAWSANHRLAFITPAGCGVWTADADGMSAANVVPCREPWGGVLDTALSADGRRLAFTAIWSEPGYDEDEGGDEHVRVYVAGRDGKAHRLRDGSQPAWSPDGKRIAYVGRDYRSIKIMRTDGSHPRTLVRNLLFPSSLNFSPDGSSLVFHEWHRVRGASSFRLRVVELDDGEVQMLPMKGNPLAAAWSPDGKRITYLWERYWAPGQGKPPTQIWTMRPDGTHQRHRFTLADRRFADSIAWLPR